MATAPPTVTSPEAQAPVPAAPVAPSAPATPSPATAAAVHASAPVSASSTPATSIGGSGRKSRAGRRPSPVWDYFTAIRTEHNTVHAQCNFCERRCAGVAARMVHHVVSKCPAASHDAVDALSGEAAMLAAAAATKKRKTGENASSGGAKIKSSPPVKLQQFPQYQPVIGAVGTVASIALPPVPTAAAAVVEYAAEQQVAIAHQKLVLACVLNDIPLRFVESEALMDAFSALRRDFPRLTEQVAQNVVLEDLHREMVKSVDESLRHLEHFAIIHRRFPEAHASGDQWLGLDGKSEPLLLAQLDSSDNAQEPNVTSPQERLAAAETLMDTQCARLSATATVYFCTDDSELFSHLRTRQHAPPPPAVDDQDEQETPDSEPPRLKSLLLGTCLLQQTMLLHTQLLELVPSVATLLQEATALVYTLTSHPRLSSSLRAALLDLTQATSVGAAAGASATSTDQAKWEMSVRLVKRLVALESELRAFWSREGAATTAAANQSESMKDSDDANTNALPPHRDAFWDELRQVEVLLAPASWALALSESDVALSGSVTSAQFVLLWLWLLSIVHTSALVSADQRAAFTTHVVTSIRKHVDDHQLACMLLDPRVHGVGLSATGKRKVKALVVQVAARVFPDAGFQVSGALARTQLLAHLGHYSEKTSQFADDIAWEMSAGKAAELFWKDYVEDARELAKVARAVIKFVPHASASSAVASDLPASGSTSTSQQDATVPLELSFRIRQIKQLYERQVASGAAVKAPERSHAATSEVAVALEGAASVKRQRAADSVSALPPLPESAFELPVEDSWFAFRGAGECKEIEAAVKRCVPTSVAVVL
ncbi:hypothetical protein Gpo141_00010286 [Globisporangium polare]